MDQIDPLIGSIIQERYRVLRQLGRGGMGTVYVAENLSIGRQVAIKLLPPNLANDEEYVRRFRREAQQAAKVTDPRVVATYDFGRAADGNLFIVMELVEGETLREILRRGPLPVEEAIDLGLQLAEALHAAHRLGIVHRDVKPDNVMVEDGVRVKLMDFGIAKPTDAGHTRFTQTGLIVGTPRYMAPEQIEGQEISARTDVYAWGVLFYEMLSGKAPFEAPTPAAIYVKHLTEAPPLLRQAGRELPAGVERIARRALEKKPEQRHADMAEVASELRALRAPVSPSAVALTQPGIALQSPSRKLRAGLVATSLLALLFAGLAAYFATREPAAGASPLAPEDDGRVAALNAEIARLQSGSAALKLIENGSFKVCNTGSNTAKIQWLGATYRDGDGFATFNSAFHDYKTWNIAAKASETLAMTDGTPKWDGSVVFFAMEIVYQGNTYNLAGPWTTAKDGCIRLEFPE